MTKALIILLLLSGYSGNMNEPGIDYSPRLLHRELTTIFMSGDYSINEYDGEDISSGSSLTSGKFFSIRNSEGENIIAYIGRVNSCRAGGCSNPSLAGTDGESEYFDYFILFDSEKRVKLVRVFNYAATHGQEVAVKRWLDQFAGHDEAKPLRVGKEIDAISGATISVYAIVADVQEKTMLLNK
jgi:hypothetical protein